MQSHEMIISRPKLSKSGKGLFFPNEQDRNVSVSWMLLAHFEINEENYKRLNGATLVVPAGSMGRLYGTFLVKAIEDIIFSESPEEYEERKEVVKKKIEEARPETKNFISFSVGEIELDEHQQKAYEMIKNNKISMITGYAGTGKSSTVRVISERLMKEGWNISRVAPTGKASKVIGGNTVHSWLEPILRTSGSYVEIIGFKKDTMTEDECLIVDESSMMDDELWEEVKKVWNGSSDIDNKKIIFVGDQGQLKPVGDGEPFLRSIKNKTFPMTELKTIHRVKGNDEIMNFVNKIRSDGTMAIKDTYKNISFITKNEAFREVANNTSIQMLTPLRNYSSGSLNINKEIKELINVSTKEVFKTIIFSKEVSNWVDHTPVHVNDKIIIVKNLWEWDVTNGTTAIFIGKEKARIYNHVKHTSMMRQCFKFLNTTNDEIFYLPINKDTRRNIELAYAITIHKAQGSEFDDVIVFLNGRKVDKRMLYTAVTRAKKTLKFVL